MMDKGTGIPGRWLRVAAIDVDATEVSCLWAAIDRPTGVMRLYDEIVTPRTSMVMHADAMKRRGAWIPVLLETEARNRSKAAGIKIARVLDEAGLSVFTVDLDQEEAVIEIGQRIGANALKVFDTMKLWPDAYRRYHRDEDGKLPVEGHGLMRATQLLALYGPGLGISEIRGTSEAEELDLDAYDRNSITGY
jgi:hypothetical protein